MQIEISDQTAEDLLEYAQMKGIDGGVLAAIDHLLFVWNMDEGEPQTTFTTPDVQKFSEAIDKVLGNGTLNLERVTVEKIEIAEEEDHRNISAFADYAKHYPKDVLILEALKMGEVEQFALGTVYDHISSSQFSTSKARELWQRQIQIMKE